MIKKNLDFFFYFATEGKMYVCSMSVFNRIILALTSNEINVKLKINQNLLTDVFVFFLRNFLDKTKKFRFN